MLRNEEVVIDDDLPMDFSLPPDVQRAIETLLPSTDALDQPTFNPISYINTLFPSEQSLASIDEVVRQMEHKLQNVDANIGAVLRSRPSAADSGRAALKEAAELIDRLHSSTADIRVKAKQSEKTVSDITRGITQMDGAKRNLTAAILTLNRLHMLVAGVRNLKSLVSHRQYGDIVMPLQAVSEVMKHFAPYLYIPQIQQITAQVAELRATLADQIAADFHDAFFGPRAKYFVPNRKLADACSVVSALDPKVMLDIVKRFAKVQLGEYGVLFSESEDCAWLDNISKRFGWFKKHLLECEEKFGALFPPQWEVSERITVEFCRTTKTDLARLLAKRKNELDVKLLLHAIQKTSDFEHLLARRFTGVTFDKRVKQYTLQSDSVNTMRVDPKGSELSSPFIGIIGDVFVPYLHIYIESLDRNLYDMMERFVSDARTDLFEGNTTASTQGVLSSCSDLFVFYKKCLIQCTHLSTGVCMLRLAGTFKKYLKKYALNILQASLTKTAKASSPLSVRNINDFRDLSSAVQNFLNDSDAGKYSKEDIGRVCCILTTAEYCLDTTQQLEGKLKEKIAPVLTDKVNLCEEVEMFRNVISSSIQLLVQDLLTSCEPALTAMTKIQWQNVDFVGDQSGYISSIGVQLSASVPIVKANLCTSRKYFIQYCIKFANAFIAKFINNLYSCKPVCIIGAEQLLLDTHMLKTLLLDLPATGSSVKRKAPSSYTKLVVKGMTRAEMVLKVVMVHTEPGKAFVEKFLKLLPGVTDVREFQKVLEMKGLKTFERNHLMHLFRHRYSKEFAAKAPTSDLPKQDSSSKAVTKNFVIGEFD